MSSTLSLLGRLFAFPSGRDGQAELMQKQAVGAIGDQAAPPEPLRRHGSAPDPQRVLQEVLAAKVLDAWLANRHQTLFPLTLNLALLDPPARLLLMRIVALSILASGATPTPAERDRLWGELGAINAGQPERAAFEAELTAPTPLPPLLSALQEAHLGPHAYAASLLVLDRQAGTSRSWLDFLAARFGLPPEVVLGLQRRRRARR